MLILGLAIALAFNLLVIYYKFTHDRFADAALDTSALILLAIVFGGSSQNLAVATIASAIISVYLYYFPPGYNTPKENTEDAVPYTYKKEQV